MMSRYGILFAALVTIAGVLTAGELRADVVELRSGEVISGKWLGGTQATVRFEIDGQVRVIPIADVLAITFDGRPGATSGGSTPGDSTAGGAQPPVAPPPVSPPPGEKARTVPARTPLLVRVRDPIDSNRHRAGHRFTAVLEGSLSIDGRVVAKAGSPVYGQIVESKQSRRVAGRSELQITLTGIRIDGTIVSIRTGDAKAVSSSTAGDSAGKVARGAAVGGLVNGKKGARRGAKVGAGAAILTRGSSIYIPPGTLIEFPLATPFTY